jgi:TPR repeat protein
MRWRVVGVLLLLSIVVAMPAWAGLDEGLEAAIHGDDATALRELLPLAQQGNAAAQYNLGVMYSNGRGVPQDYAQARKRSTGF